jgi:hypothetical protein
MTNLRIGQGFDVHALVPGRPLIIGGVSIPFPQGLLGHSDADVLLHALTDALLVQPGSATSVGCSPIPTLSMPAPTAAYCCAKPSSACALPASRW